MIKEKLNKIENVNLMLDLRKISFALLQPRAQVND